MTRPLLEEEVRQIGTSVCRSLSTDISAYRLLSKPDQLEARLVEMTWLQPSIVRLDVIQKVGGSLKLIASNVVETNPIDPEEIQIEDLPKSELKKDDSRKFWDIYYPVKENKKILAYIHAEVSLQLADQVVRIFSKIAFLGAFFAIGLLILLLSHYLRRMLDENVELTEQLHEVQRQLFLKEKLAVMGQLTASIAHEIGTPLNSLSGHLQLLGEEIRTEGAKSRIDVILSQVHRIEGIVKEFLASTHTPPQQKQLVDIRDSIHRITNLVGPRVKSIRCEVKVDVSSDVEPMRLVPSDFEQVLLNITNNALDALQSGKAFEKMLTYQARLSTEKGKKILQLEISDSGEGISPQTMKQVLKPFFTTKGPSQGTGLGLTISQRLIKKYDGKLELQSSLGKGTTVKVTIPYDAA